MRTSSTNFTARLNGPCLRSRREPKSRSGIEHVWGGLRADLSPTTEITDDCSNNVHSLNRSHLDRGVSHGKPRCVWSRQGAGQRSKLSGAPPSAVVEEAELLWC
jgi:hypothetical protein